MSGTYHIIVRMTSRNVQRAAYRPEDVICTQVLAFDQAMKQVRAILTHKMSQLQIGGSSAIAQQTRWGTVPCPEAAAAGQSACVPGRQGRAHGRTSPLQAPAALLESNLQVQVVRRPQYLARLHVFSPDVGVMSPLGSYVPSDLQISMESNASIPC